MTEEVKTKYPKPKDYDEFFGYTVPAGEEGMAWDRLPGESALWYRRFTRYRLMGPSRSVSRTKNDEWEAKGQKRSGKTPGQAWYNAYNRDRWEERAQAWDGYILEQEEIAWKERRTAIREREHELVEQLFQKVEEMLMFPVARQETQTEQQGGRIVNVTIIEPADWKLRDITALLETASKVGRLSSEMATSISEARHVAVDESLTDEERLERVSEIVRQARMRGGNHREEGND
jgi:hypothetical protein